MPQAQIKAKCVEVFAKAKELYGVDLSKTTISFDLTGRIAGWARMHRGQLSMRFNRDMIAREAFNHIINDTVPHEIAHLVCFLNPKLGRNHDYGWSRVCRALGGSGARCHEEDVVYGKGKTYEYTTTNGKTVRLSERRHADVQAGRSLAYRKGLGTVNRMCAYSIVGVQGRTLAKPIVKQAPNHPASIEEVVRAAQVKPQLQPLFKLPTPAEAKAKLAAGKATGTDQYPAAFSKAAITTTPAPTASEVLLHGMLAGESKAAASRRIMLTEYRKGTAYEDIICYMIQACGYDRQLARATYRANATKVGIPQQ